MPVPQREIGLLASRRLLTEDVFERLRDEIVRGMLAPGQKIHDLELAARLGFSRATVRTALLRLTDIGLVEAVPNMFTRVTRIDVDHYADVQDAARSLYVYAARRGTPQLTEEHLERFHAWSGTLVGGTTVDAEAIFDGRVLHGFFRVFLEALDNAPLGRTLDRLRPHLQRVMGQYATLLPADEIRMAFLRVVEAADGRDGEAAADALADYYDGPLATFERRLREQPELRPETPNS